MRKRWMCVDPDVLPRIGCAWMRVPLRCRQCGCCLYLSRYAIRDRKFLCECDSYYMPVPFNAIGLSSREMSLKEVLGV